MYQSTVRQCLNCIASVSKSFGRAQARGGKRRESGAPQAGGRVGGGGAPAPHLCAAQEGGRGARRAEGCSAAPGGAGAGVGASASFPAWESCYDVTYMHL